MRVGLGLVLVAGVVGCRHRAPEPAELPFELPAGFALTPPPAPEGPIAGPRNVVQEAPPPPVPSDVPGQGPMVPYVSKLRKSVQERISACTSAEPPAPAQIDLVVAADGSLVSAVLQRSSGDTAWDACLTGAVQADLPPPPPELAGAGAVRLPTLVFR